MHELTKRLLDARKQGRPALLPYLMAGDGGFEKSAALISLYEDCGAEAIEIGIPFSDPVADGPVIQAAGIRALESGTSLRTSLEWLKNLHEPKVPRIIMSYLNPILRMGIDAFFKEAKSAHISAVIIPDLPMEEMDICIEASTGTGIPMIPLAAPSTSSQRLQQIRSKTDGFVYAVTVNGVTGSREGFDDALKTRLAKIRRESGLPVVAGFGISSAEQVAELKPFCDGFVVGSMLVNMAFRDDYTGIRDFFAKAGR